MDFGNLGIIAQMGLPRTSPCATITIAAHNASAKSKRGADVICKGVNDDEIINEAIRALNVTGGGIIELTEGDFLLSLPVEVIGNTTICGKGVDATTFTCVNFNTGGSIGAFKLIGEYAFMRGFTFDGNLQKGTEGKEFIFAKSYTNPEMHQGKSTYHFFDLHVKKCNIGIYIFEQYKECNIFAHHIVFDSLIGDSFIAENSHYANCISNYYFTDSISRRTRNTNSKNISVWGDYDFPANVFIDKIIGDVDFYVEPRTKVSITNCNCRKMIIQSTQALITNNITKEGILDSSGSDTNHIFNNFIEN